MNKIIKPWGREIVLLRSKKYWVKEIFVKDDHQSSLQSHRNRTETWITLSGKGVAVIGARRRSLKAGDVVKITRGQKHRWIGIKKLSVLEIALGGLNEKDIIRYKDDYGRAS